MKRLFTLIALLGLVALYTGCQEKSTPTEGAPTNAPSASTNAPAAK